MKMKLFSLFILTFFMATNVYCQSNELPDRLGRSGYWISNHYENVEIDLRMSDTLVIITNLEEHDFLQLGDVVNTSILGNIIKIHYKKSLLLQDLNATFSLYEKKVGKDSFLFLHGINSLQGEHGRVYYNGRLVSKRIIQEGKPPYTPVSVKEVGEEIYIKYENVKHQVMYVVFDRK